MSDRQELSDAEANMAAQEETPTARARLQAEDAHRCWPQGDQGQASQGAQTAHGLNACCLIVRHRRVPKPGVHAAVAAPTVDREAGTVTAG